MFVVGVCVAAVVSGAVASADLFGLSEPAAARTVAAAPIAADGDGGDTGLLDIPTLAMLAETSDGPIPTELRLAVVDALSEVNGVRRVTAEPRPNADVAPDRWLTVFYLALDDNDADRRTVDRLVGRAEVAIARQLPNADIMVGGPAVVDGELVERFATSARALAVLAVLAGAALGLVFGWKRGLVAAGTLGLTVVAAGSLGHQIAGRFDGSMAATAVPGALGGLVFGVAIAVRLLLWFRDPEGADGAEMIRRSMLQLLPEIGAVLVGLLVSTVVVGLMDSGPTPLTAMLAGAVVAVAVQAGVMAPALALLTEAKEANPDLLPFTVPDGRDLPLLVLSGVGLLLVVLSLFGFGRPGVSLSSVPDLDDDQPPAVVSELLRTSGGDATSALVATPAEAASQVDLVEWARAAAELAAVEWVEVGSVRFSSVGEVALEPTAKVLDPAIAEQALVVLTVPPRSEEARVAVAELNALPLVGGPPALTGTAIDAIGASGARSTVLVAVLIMAVAGAIGVRVLTQSGAQSVVSFLLRVLGGLTLLGVFSLIGSQVSAAVMVTGLGALGLAVGLFELEFLGQFHERGEGVEDHGFNAGQAGAIGLAVLGVGGLVLAVTSLLGGGPGTGVLGMALAIGVLIELAVGALLLRPALLGQRAAFHTAVRPVRVAMHSGLERHDQHGGTEDPGWRRVIGDLLQAEFRFQSQPADAVLSGVFVPDTPLYRQAASHHANLAGAGLRIVGRGPRLRSIKTVSGRTPITLAVTVDHPARQLVDNQGTVVGVRNAERRSGVLWLSQADDGSYRIAESVELGSVALPEPGLVEELDLTGVEAMVGATKDERSDHTADPANPLAIPDLEAGDGDGNGDGRGEHGHSDEQRLRS